MHKLVSFNHEVLPSNQPSIKAISSSSLYGRGVFTTVAFYNSKPFLWEKHWRRLNENAEKLGVNISKFDKTNVENALAEIAKRNEVIDGRCRLTFFDESSRKIWQSSTENEASLLIQTADFREVKKRTSLTLSPYIINSSSPLAGVKSCNYLENILALEEAKKDDFDEAIRINEKNKIVSACMANVFWYEYDKETLFTPSLKTGCLAGTIRGFLMENYHVVEVEKEINELLRDAEYLFLTSSGINVAQVADFDREIKFQKKSHPLTKAVENELRNGSATA